MAGKGRQKHHERDGFDVIQNHVRISAQRVHRARLQTSVTPRCPQETVEEPEQVAALGQFLEAKMKVSTVSNAETVAIPEHQRCHGSKGLFGLEMKLSRIAKQRKRRSGMQLPPSSSAQRVNVNETKARHAAAVNSAPTQHHEHNDNPLDLSDKALSAFRAVAHVWLSRKRRQEKAMRENVTNKLVLHQSKELSPVVFDIISKSFVAPMPALQFFDTEGNNEPIKLKRDLIPTTPSSGRQVNVSRPLKPNSIQPSQTPRGICYTINAKGQRQSKMQHSVGDILAEHHICKNHVHENPKYSTTMEDAVIYTLNRKLKKRMIVKKNRILDISSSFVTNQEQLKQTLSAKLAMHWAEREHLHASKLEAACLNDTNIPSFRVDRDQQLGRIRHQKSRLRQLCQTLSAFGALLRWHQDNREELTKPEIHLLSLLRILIDNNCVLTPVVVQGIQSQLTPSDLQCPHVQVKSNITTI
ncbi:hypothetical protein THRCLA_06465 [Thraustotheca clavata]|uniref:Uncharacterized protein n=1 Tax=Thraustotheca clavata TaxID=74557 RepID=A0A1V9ZNI6_9STRA|nr:hypothetical protein THRCLA_06465 [Thraustotheca clavata]